MLEAPALAHSQFWKLHEPLPSFRFLCPFSISSGLTDGTSRRTDGTTGGKIFAIVCPRFRRVPTLAPRSGSHTHSLSRGIQLGQSVVYALSPPPPSLFKFVLSFLRNDRKVHKIIVNRRDGGGDFEINRNYTRIGWDGGSRVSNMPGSHVSDASTTNLYDFLLAL